MGSFLCREFLILGAIAQGIDPAHLQVHFEACRPFPIFLHRWSRSGPAADADRGVALGVSGKGTRLHTSYAPPLDYQAAG